MLYFWIYIAFGLIVAFADWGYFYKNNLLKNYDIGIILQAEINIWKDEIDYDIVESHNKPKKFYKAGKIIEAIVRFFWGAIIWPIRIYNARQEGGFYELLDNECRRLSRTV